MLLPARVAALGIAGTLIVVPWLAACDEDAPDTADRESAQGTPASVPADLVERGCRTQIEGKALEPGRGDLVVGPVTFFAARGFARTDDPRLAVTRRPPGAWGSAWKSITEVESEVSATVIVPARYSDSLLLLYRRGARSIRVNGVETGWHPRSAGNPAVRFAACPAPPAGRTHAFNGGFLVREPGCYQIEVLREDDPEPELATIGFAVGRDGCPHDS